MASDIPDVGWGEEGETYPMHCWMAFGSKVYEGYLFRSDRDATPEWRFVDTFGFTMDTGGHSKKRPERFRARMVDAAQDAASYALEQFAKADKECLQASRLLVELRMAQSSGKQ